jgi:hypothetical protein
MSKEIVTVERNLSSQGIGNQAAGKNWSQFATSSKKHSGARYRPNPFTEQGVVMALPEKPRRQIGFHVQEKPPRCRTANHR